jgi:metal-dependent amidase/aminoacylase/carboxypeptidase family protein
MAMIHHVHTTQRLGVWTVALAWTLVGGVAAGSTLVERIREKAHEIQPQMVEVRRQIHMWPELSGEERDTAQLIATRLRELGLEVQTGVGGHGVVGLLQGEKPGPVVAYRADMDAVRSEVVGNPSYRSRAPGIKQPGSVKFLFQPAEENVQGARAMIASGALQDPAPAAIFALHTAPMRVGSIGAPAGVGLTGWDPFEIELVDGDTAPAVLDSLQSLSTIPPLASQADMGTLLDEMAVEGGRLSHFVWVTGLRTEKTSDGGRLVHGMVRAAGDSEYEQTRARIRQVLERVTTTSSEFRLEWGERFPDMHSDPELVRAAIEPIEAAIGEGATIPMYASAPFFGEDFALFQQHIPGAMFFLGAANLEKGIAAFNHTPDYDIDEEALEVGAAAMASVLLHYLGSHSEEPLRGHGK